MKQEMQWPVGTSIALRPSGNEGFWTDAMRLPQGVLAAKFTPIQALKAGLQVDIEAVPPDMRAAMAAELKTDLSPEKAPQVE